jgi:hypothetical protein
MIIQILQRRDTTANWNNFNPTLAEGELGIEFKLEGTKKLKVGDGVKSWAQLEYFNIGVDLDTFLAHINNNTNAHGIDIIKNNVSNLQTGLNSAETNINAHINNTANAHGIDIMKNDINEVETNFTNLYQNVTLHINNNTSAHGINNIK